VTSPRYGALPVTSTGWPFGACRLASTIWVSARETFGDAFDEQLAEDGGSGQLGGRRAHVEQLAGAGVEVVVAVAELDAGVACRRRRR
jgi:hypothetical protein